MSKSFPQPPESLQPTAPVSVNLEGQREPFSARHQRSWLQRASTLPPRVYQQAVDRLVRGDSALSVARWLMTQPDRGGLNNVGARSLERHITVLAAKVREQKALYPSASMQQVVAAIPDVSVLAPAAKADFKTVDEFVADRCEVFNRQTFAAGVVVSCWEAMERLRWAEEAMVQSPEKALPLHSMMANRATLANAIIAACDMLRKNDETELLKQKVLGLEVTQRSGGQLPQLAGQLMAKVSELQQVTEDPETSGMSEDQRQLVMVAADKFLGMLRLIQDDPSLLDEMRLNGDPSKQS